MFARKDKESVEDYNKRLEAEVNSPESEEKKPIDKVNVLGNVLTGIGMSFQMVAGIGAGVMGCIAVATLLGVSMMTTVLILAGVGITLSLIGNKIATEPLFNLA